ncbi:MAG: NnrS family protein [Gammaproteobacteria bacterium]|nr:MAG: NnrS family protein [Gammaproteobacteria bacterium]
MLIEKPGNYRIGFHHLGFRPFFLLGTIFAVAVVAIWLWMLSYQGGLPRGNMSGPAQWHGHEMLFGYALAIISGFLLTAERNWTGVQTLHGAPLLILAALWSLARIMPFIPHPQAILIMAILDLTFNGLLSIALLYPIVKTRQWKHLAIWINILLLLVANAIFYLGVFNKLDDGSRIGLYMALYIIIALILLMSRRVVPFFIERGVGYTVTLRNHRWIDSSSLVLLLIFVILEVFILAPAYAALIAAALAILHAWRLWGWYTHGIWKKPLIWSLYLAYAWLIAGFALKALSYWSMLDPMLAIHAFTYGGVGMMTLGMMARVTLGHTGRNVFNPPRALSLLFLLLLTGTVMRVVMPMLTPDSYAMWIMLSQWMWIAAFSGFVLVFASMLVKARVDGKYG